MDFQDQPHDQRREGGGHEQGMACATVIGEVAHRVAQGYEHVEVRQGAKQRAPECGAVTDLAAEHGLADSRAERELGEGVHKP